MHWAGDGMPHAAMRILETEPSPIRRFWALNLETHFWRHFSCHRVERSDRALRSGSGRNVRSNVHSKFARLHFSSTGNRLGLGLGARAGKLVVNGTSFSSRERDRKFSTCRGCGMSPEQGSFDGQQ